MFNGFMRQLVLIWLGGGILTALSTVRTESLEYPTLPDLELISLFLTSHDPNPMLTVRVRNNGLLFTGDAVFSLRQEGSSGTAIRLNLSRGSTQDFALTPVDRNELLRSACGLFFVVRIDPGNLIRESNEANNALSKTILKYLTPDGRITYPVKIGREGSTQNISSATGVTVPIFVPNRQIIFDKLTGRHRFSLNLYLKIKNCGDQPISGGQIMLSRHTACSYSAVMGLAIPPGGTTDVVLPMTFYLRRLRDCENRPHLEVVIVDIPGELGDELYFNNICNFHIQFTFEPSLELGSHLASSAIFRLPM